LSAVVESPPSRVARAESSKTDRYGAEERQEQKEEYGDDKKSWTEGMTKR
jgi:hypothetical protein